GGIAQGPGNYVLSQSLPVENGINRIIIRSGFNPDNIKIEATSKGLKPAKLTLKTWPFETVNGLGTKLPGAGLKPFLGKGPTPSSPSYTKKRQTVFIKHAETTSNAENAYFSYDDNELTEWRNDGKMNTAKITYNLAKPSVVTECVAKFTGWRTKSYPIRILADGILVYEGHTEQSLG